ncbi:MAG TPA: hypothetical protein VJN48_07125, partial [Terriglobales bacterium]|nr:hypothetical protein [Terriglobales bacterium]
QPLRDKMKQRGYEQAARFSWEASARRILQAYREVLGEKRPEASLPPVEEATVATPQKPSS